jgi:hypothetical protein
MMYGKDTTRRISTMQSRVLRVAIAIVAGAILVVPGFLMAVAWGGTLNLEVAIAATVISIAVAIWLPKLRWGGAVIAALLIAVPPFPYWTSWDEKTGLHLHFFHGYNLQSLPVFRFVVVFLVAMLLFAVIFWAIGKRPVARAP